MYDNIAAERALLGGLMQRPREIAKVGAILTAKDFAWLKHANLFLLLLAKSAAGEPIDLVTVPAACADSASSFGGLEYVIQLPDFIPSTANLEHYAKQIHECSERRRVRDLLASAAGEVQSGDLAELCRRVAAEVAPKQPVTGCTLKQAVSARLDAIEQEQAGQLRGPMATGYPELDAMLGGGLRAQRCYVVAARPGMGKTAFALELALHLADSVSVGLVSCEMTAGQLVDRMLACLSGVRIGVLQDPRARLGSYHWPHLLDAQETLSGLRMALDDRAGLTLAQISAQAEAWASRPEGLDVLVVDYLQLVRGSAAYRGQRHLELGELVTGLRDLGKRLGCAVVLLSQLNRGVEGRASKRPALSDLRESGAIEEAANVVLMLYRQN